MNKVPMAPTDIFGHTLDPGDIFVYCPGSKRNASLRVGIFIESFINNIGDFKIKVMLVTSPSKWSSKDVFSIIKPEVFSQRCSIVANPYFHIDSEIMIKTLKLIDKLKLDGVLPDFNDSPDQIQE